jgi:hypothetical protein
VADGRRGDVARSILGHRQMPRPRMASANVAGSSIALR